MKEITLLQEDSVSTTSDTSGQAARIDKAATFLRAQLGLHAQAKLAVVLGSGLGAFADQLDQSIIIPYADIPHFPVSAVPGHAGQLVAGTLGGVPVLVLQGRVHAYEGYSATCVVFGVRTLAALGVKVLVLTNAAGGIRLDLRQGQLVLLSDHINFTGLNPSAGPAPAGQPRFFDMTGAYSNPLRELAQAASSIPLAEGVYIGVLGPSFETPAEIRAFRTLGADLVGMSTVLETIAARQAGVKVLGVSCVTNMAAGITAHPLSHEEVLATGRAAEHQLAALLTGFVPLALASLTENSQ